MLNMSMVNFMEGKVIFMYRVIGLWSITIPIYCFLSMVTQRIVMDDIDVLQIRLLPK